MSWYATIEHGIRRQVRLLADNGFNTMTSCEHRMEVTLDISTHEDLARLYDVLSRSGFMDYTILARVERRRGHLRSDAVVQIGDDRARHRIARRHRSLVSWWWEPPPCKHEWVPRANDEEPKVCPQCKSAYWNTPRQHKAESKVKSR